MDTTLHLLKEKFKQALLATYPILKEEQTEIDPEVVQSTSEKFGDYQCNAPMKLVKKLKEAPRTIAEKLTSALTAIPFIQKLEVAGPGFINITLNPSYVENQLSEMLKSSTLGISPPQTKQTTIVEFSSPNVAKEMHVGHLRSTIIGESLARLFEFLGHHVIRLNHIGDWGTAFGMLIAYLKEEHPDVAKGEEETDLTHLMQWYKLSKLRFDENPEFKKRSQLEVVELQGGNEESLRIWNIICEISRKAYQEIYDLLKVTLNERGESYYNPVLVDLIKDLEEKNLLELSDGAKCFFVPEYTNREGSPMPLMLQKSDGGFGYDTTDMAAMKQRVEEEKADRIIVITDAGQSRHFDLIYAASCRAGYLDPKKVRFDHVPFGLVLGPDGKKFRTRSGETERLIDLLSNAVTKADEIMKERNPTMPDEARNAAAHALGIGAVKYADLSCHRLSDYSFSYDRMLRFEGNTAAFLMYVYVRIAGIKRKAAKEIEKLQKEFHIELKHPSEISLGIHLLQFGETLDEVASNLLPNRLTDYLYKLSEKFNAFYRDCQVEGSSEENSRLLLAELTSRVMKQGLYLLGVETIEKM